MSIPKRRLLLAAALGIAVILTIFLSGLLAPHSAPRYTVTDLGVLPGYTTSGADAINRRGEAVGSVSGTRSRAVLFRNGRLTDLGVLPGGSDSEARAINSAGDVTGGATLPTGRHAFLYSGGRMRDLGIPPGYTDSTGVGVSDRGEVVVNATGRPTQTGTPRGQVFLDRAGRMTGIRLPLGCSKMYALNINNAGQIASGGRWNARYAGPTGPFLYDSRTGMMTVLPVPTSYLRDYVNHVNDAGEVIGVVDLSGGLLHAALWRGNRMTDLGAPLGYPISVGEDLNNRGEAVGSCFIGEDSVKGFLRMHTSAHNPLRHYLDRDTEHAFVYRDGKMQDLNELISRDSDWTLESARGINDRGQIVGQGQHHGQERGFLLTPIR